MQDRDPDGDPDRGPVALGGATDGSRHPPVTLGSDMSCATAIMRAGGWESVNVLGRYLEFAEHNVWA